MKRPIVFLLILLLLLLGVQRTPEAQVAEFVVGGVATAVVTGMVVGGCVHAVASAKPDAADPAVMLPPTETPATP